MRLHRSFRLPKSLELEVSENAWKHANAKKSSGASWYPRETYSNIMNSSESSHRRYEKIKTYQNYWTYNFVGPKFLLSRKILEPLQIAGIEKTVVPSVAGSGAVTVPLSSLHIYIYPIDLIVYTIFYHASPSLGFQFLQCKLSFANRKCQDVPGACHRVETPR